MPSMPPPTEAVTNPARCQASLDGWCKTHSTGDGPAWCVDALRDAVRRARFHEQQNHQRALDSDALAQRYRLAWQSARRRAAHEKGAVGSQVECEGCGRRYDLVNIVDHIRAYHGGRRR